MPFVNHSVQTQNTAGAWDDIDRNFLTYAGTLVAASTIGGCAGVGAVVLPGFATVGLAAAGTMYYAGHRQAEGLPFIPEFGKKDDKSDNKTLAKSDKVKITVKSVDETEQQAEPVPAAA